MVLRMARPTKHLKTGIGQFRARIPRDLLTKARGRQINFPPEAGGGVVIIGPRSEHVKVSLRTSDNARIRERSAAALAHLEKFWEALRQGPRPLSKKRRVMLAGRVYRAFAEGAEDDPGSSDVWVRALVLDAKAMAGELAPALRIYMSEQERKAASMEARYGKIADTLLNSEAIVTDPASRAALLEELHFALVQANLKLKRNAEGDYAPDPDASRFPEYEPPNAPKVADAVSVTALFEGWKAEAKAADRTAKTLKEYGSIVARFVKFIGHDDARRVTVHDVLRWKEHRIAEGRSLKTIAHSDLACVKSVFGWGKRNHRIPTNPAAEVTVKLGRKANERPNGFTADEAALILNAALNYRKTAREDVKTAAAKRWVPWLCSYTGARVGEMVQLRREDVRHEGGHWIAAITPAAGTVKNKQRREVVLHPHLIEQGFADFIVKSQGYLFLRAKNKGEALGKLQAVKNRLAEFGRALVTDKRVAPNHGWRHRFKTVGREAGVEERVLNAICGHAPGSVGAEYGNVTIKTQANALAKFPRYEISRAALAA